MKISTAIIAMILLTGVAIADTNTIIDYKDYEYPTLNKNLDYSAAGQSYASFNKIKRTTILESAPYNVQPIGYEYNPLTDYYTVYFNIFSNTDQPISTNSIVVAGTESLYEVHTRMQKEAWIQWQVQAGGFRPALDHYIKTFYYNRYSLVCQE